jgi:hypothetical protein
MNLIDKSAVNRMLMSQGLGKLNDPGLIPQIGFLVSRVVTNHAGFCELIERCEPAERGNMYEAMRPYLRFEVKPLDVYVAEIGMRAEAKRLAVIDPESGELRPFRVPEIKTGALGVAQASVEREFAKFHLTLLCKQCTREQTFCGAFKDDAVRFARAAGWRTRLARQEAIGGEDAVEDVSKLVETFQYELCPKCAG